MVWAAAVIQLYLVWCVSHTGGEPKLLVGLMGHGHVWQYCHMVLAPCKAPREQLQYALPCVVGLELLQHLPTLASAVTEMKGTEWHSTACCPPLTVHQVFG